MVSSISKWNENHLIYDRLWEKFGRRLERTINLDITLILMQKGAYPGREQLVKVDVRTQSGERIFFADDAKNSPSDFLVAQLILLNG